MAMTRKAARGSLRWYKDEWTRVLTGVGTTATIDALAQLSYDAERTRDRLEEVEHALNDALVEIAQTRQLLVMMSSQIQSIARGPDLGWASAKRPLERPN
jgi:hypothetical protein